MEIENKQIKERDTEDAEELLEYVPNYIKNQDKRQQKMFMMCKYFAHGY